MVRLFEYQGKRLLRSVGIPVPEGSVATSPREAVEVAKKIGGQIVIKGQVLMAGRFKAGCIKFADSPKEVGSITRELLGKKIRGLSIEKVLVEEKFDIDKEFFISLTVSDSYKIRGPIMLFSTKGGVEVEKVNAKHPKRICRMNIDYLSGLQLSDACKFISEFEISKDLVDKLSDIAFKMYGVFKKWDANTIEINPLILANDGKMVAADCKIMLDDNSVFRHPEFKIELPRDMTRPPTELEKIAWKIEERDYRGVCYFIQLNPDIEEIKKGGHIAFHGIGGGASMLAADALILRGLRLATYVDTSGNPTASKIYRGIKVLLSLPRIEGYCLAGAVLANQEQWYHAYAIVKALKEEAEESLRIGFPALILLAGNKEIEAHRIIKEGLKDLPLRWELYGRDHVYDMDFFADRMKMLIEEYRRERTSHIGNANSHSEVSAGNPSEKHLLFEFRTGKLDLNLRKCIAPECGFPCVKACRWFGRSCLKIENGKPALATSPEEFKRLCNECLACEVECQLHGGNAIKIELPLYGIHEFRKKHGVSL